MLRNIKITLWGPMAGLTALWLLANLPFPDDLNILNSRNLLLQLSGVIAMGAMSVAMILAVRPIWFWCSTPSCLWTSRPGCSR